MAPLAAGGARSPAEMRERVALLSQNLEQIGTDSSCPQPDKSYLTNRLK